MRSVRQLTGISKNILFLGPMYGPIHYIGNTYPSEILYLKNWVLDRLKWLDTYMPGTCVASGIKDAGEAHCFSGGIISQSRRMNLHISIYKIRRPGHCGSRSMK